MPFANIEVVMSSIMVSHRYYLKGKVARWGGFLQSKIVIIANYKVSLVF